ncbi:hypothetical protein ACFL6C_02155 [Myxococcota bacterium]
MHHDVLAACDFFTAEVFTKTGLVTYYVLFFIKTGSRDVHIAGSGLQILRGVPLGCQANGYQARQVACAVAEFERLRRTCSLVRRGCVGP